MHESLLSQELWFINLSAEFSYVDLMLMSLKQRHFELRGEHFSSRLGLSIYTGKTGGHIKHKMCTSLS